MKHARKDYDRIQDPSGKIPVNEPVFLLRGQDLMAPDTVRFWADAAEQAGADPAIVMVAREQAIKMEWWQRHTRFKVPDMPESA